MGLTSFIFSNNQWFEADCFQITLPNGFVINATSHQTNVVVGGTTYYATKYGKWARGKVTHERNAVTEMDLMLASDEAISFPIPQVPGVGTQTAADNFTRANANPLSGNWTAVSGAPPQLVSNSVQGTAFNVLCAANYNGVAWTPDQYSEVTVGTLASSNDYVAANVRMVSGITGYTLYVRGPLGAGAGSCYVDRYAAGTPTQVGTTVSGLTISTGDKFRLEAIGTTIIVRQNGVIVMQATDATYAAGSAGIGTLNSAAFNSSITNWTGGNILPPNASTDNLLASDNFQRANANPLAGNWTTLATAMQLLSNAVEGTTSTGNLNAASFNGVVWPNDQWSEVTLGATPTGGDFIAAIVRASGAFSGYTLYIHGPVGAGTASAELRVYPANQVLATVTNISTAVGDKFRLEVQGTQLTARQNGVVLFQVTDATIASGVAGMGVVDTSSLGATITKWQGGSITQGRPNTAMFQRSKLFMKSKIQVTVAYLDLAAQTVQGSYVAFVGYITSPSIESQLVTFKCSDPGFLMALPWPRRIIQAACPYAVFDPNCTLNKASFQQTRTVAYGSNGVSLVVSSALAAIGNDALPFTLGYIVPVTGQCAGWSIGIAQQTSSTQLTLNPFDLPLQVGDQIVLVPGCNHLQTTCILKYNNVANFGGFPFVPGPESSITGN